MRRLLDLTAALAGLIFLFPFFAVTLILIWLQDRKNPLYTPDRVGENERIFRMVKFRTMVAGADKSGVSSTSADDRRITRIGQFIRWYKLDELAQLWNVFVGDMSLVGPRPNLKRETDCYTTQERKLLTVKPGITDFSSIVFSDEGEILRGAADPDLAYDQLIRPWKSRLGIFYVERRSFFLDIRLITLSVLAIVNRRAALDRVQALLRGMGAPDDLVRVSGRHDELVPHAPPGMTV